MGLKILSLFFVLEFTNETGDVMSLHGLPTIPSNTSFLAFNYLIDRENDPFLHHYHFMGSSENSQGQYFQSQIQEESEKTTINVPMSFLRYTWQGMPLCMASTDECPSWLSSFLLFSKLVSFLGKTTGRSHLPCKRWAASVGDTTGSNNNPCD